MLAGFEERRSRTGIVYYVVTRAELERAPGFRAAGGDKARACCIFHGGDNAQALEIDFAKGTARCFTRGCFARIVDAADGYGAPYRSGDRPPNRTIRTPIKKAPTTAAPVPENLIKPDISRARAGLAAAFDRARAALSSSPAAAYLERRGISLELAARYGLGWSTSGELRNRLLFPLTAPDGTITSATGRTLSDTVTPKYRNLAETRKDETTGASVPTGYAKGWFNAQAIARARDTGAPLYLCEGVFDALALLAGGIETAAAILGKRDPRLSLWLAQWVSGVPGVVFCPDEDPDGGGRAAYESAARGLLLVVPARVAPRGYLGNCKDLGEHWQRYGTLPPGLAEIGNAPEIALSAPTCPESDVLPVDDLGDVAAAPAPVDVAELLEDPDLTKPEPAPVRLTEPRPMTRARAAFLAARDRVGLHAPAALALGLTAEQAARAAEIAGELFWAWTERLFDLRLSLEAWPDDDPERAVWLAAVFEAYDRRRARRGIDRCYTCGGELRGNGACWTCAPPPGLPRFRPPVFRRDTVNT